MKAYTYTVYLRPNTVATAKGTAKECANQMGMTEEEFYRIFIKSCIHTHPDYVITCEEKMNQ